MSQAGTKHPRIAVMNRQRPRVLMMSYYFPPMGGAEVQRVTRFAKYLPEFGWEPIMLTTQGGGHTGRDESLLQRLPAAVPIERIPSVEHPTTILTLRRFEKRENGGQERRATRRLWDELVRRVSAFDRKHLCFPDPMNWWAWRAGLHIESLVKKYRPDILWATGYPWSTLCLLAKAANKTGLPAVGDIRDPWSWHPHGYWDSERHKLLERKTLLSLSHLVTVTEGLRRRYLCLYPELHERICTIRNSFEDADRRPAKARQVPSLFCYVGSLTKGNLKDQRKQTLDTFLRALRLSIDRRVDGCCQLRVGVAGQGVDRTQSLVNEYGLQDAVQIHGSLPHDKARELRACADVLLVVMGIGEGTESYVPLKVYEYLAANRPILALLPEGSEAGAIIIQKKRGVVCRANDVESICSGLRRMLSSDFEYDPQSDVSEFSCRNTTSQLAEVLNQVTLSRARGWTNTR